ncbi:Putative tartrate transporter [Paraburkholderia domus]|uniref:MFS transporter n=1 Tax=Paraburkholderia domus TaxID=2793075 RepID=UPI0019122422|nr:MFS transporter [Paraburkholderia domus]MBK5091769.1 MFS transporter [Burkholderia sp. R-69927]CAE6942098.1 Putative tartrate transporter [Paraburkholderia domus]
MNFITRSTVNTDAQWNLYNKVAKRLLPFLLLLFVVSYLDRVNVGFAKLQMAADIGLSDAAYGFGAGIFFLGYCLFEIPSNLILHRVGAKIWIARIMIVWGIVTMLTLLVKGPTSFYVARVLLGIAEAGFYPGVILYLTYWFPSHLRSQVMAIFISGIVVAGVIGGPLSGAIMTGMAGVWGFAGWQWLFALEGVPAIVLGICCLWFLSNNPSSASWLNDQEKSAIAADLMADQAATRGVAGHSHNIRSVFGNKNIWLLVIANFSNLATAYSVSFWMPQIIRNFGISNLNVIGLLTSAPFLLGGVAMLFAGWHSDKKKERRLHCCAGLLIACIGLSMSGFFITSAPVALCGLVLACVGALVATPTLWALPGTFLSGPAAAAGIALMTTVGNLSGYVAPFVIGQVKQATGSMGYGFVTMGVIALVGAIAAFCAPAARMPRVEIARAADAATQRSY